MSIASLANKNGNKIAPVSGNGIYNIVRNFSQLAGITKMMSPHRTAITAALV